MTLSIPRIAQQIGTMSMSFPRGMLHDATILVSLCILAFLWSVSFARVAQEPRSLEDAKKHEES
jgi:hypothetical protein